MGGGINTYSYVKNNPANLVDPRGLSGSDPNAGNLWPDYATKTYRDLTVNGYAPDRRDPSQPNPTTVALLNRGYGASCQVEPQYFTKAGQALVGGLGTLQEEAEQAYGEGGVAEAYESGKAAGHESDVLGSIFNYVVDAKASAEEKAGKFCYVRPALLNCSKPMTHDNN